MASHVYGGICNISINLPKALVPINIKYSAVIAESYLVKIKVPQLYLMYSALWYYKVCKKVSKDELLFFKRFFLKVGIGVTLIKT